MHIESRILCGLKVLCFAAASTLAAANASPPIARSGSVPQEALGSFFARYCNDCHAGGADEGGLDLDSLGSDLSDVATFARWERIYDRVRTGEMPPQDYGKVDDNHRSTFDQILKAWLHEAHAASKGTVLRRLNRREYQNTMNDLFGVELDLESLLPEDGRSHEFDNVGEALSVSSVHLQQYLDAADAVIDAAIADSAEKPEATVKQANYGETREGEKHIGKVWKQLEDGAVVFFKNPGYPTGMLRTANIGKPGRYRVRVTGYAYQSDQPITFSIGATTFQRGREKPTFGYRAMPPGKPSTVEIEAWIDEKYMIELTPWGISDADNEIRNDGVNQYQGRGLAILNVELEGPLINEFPSRGHRLLFAGLNRRDVRSDGAGADGARADGARADGARAKRKSSYVPQYEIESDRPAVDARRVLQRITSAAFRRPTTPSDCQRYVELFSAQMQDGASFEEALRTAVAAVFCSPDFLYLQEPQGWLDDHAIASRLSYFLTRTTPDALLLAEAKAGRLSNDPAALLAQMRRLLDDPRHQRFIVDFTDAWLNLREIEFTSPDNNLFPEYDPFLQHSMLQETRRFFATLIDDNLSVTNLVKPDFAMLNNRLALHYGIDGVTSPEIQRVELPADSIRGGLLAQASVLKVSANGTNTSPVVRGVWVMERIIGQAPPPPPPGIPGVEPDVRGASTLRELLDKHRDMDSCRSCHKMIDPPGFALESFDPIGGWRERFRSLGDGEKTDATVNGRKVRYKIGPPVDASGQLASGAKFEGFREFRDLLASDEDRLAKTLATKLLTFATGRQPGFSDREVIEDIVRQSKSRGHGVRDLIELVVTHETFRRK